MNLKRIARGIAALLTTLGLTLAVAPTPAHAIYGGDCGYGGTICLYQWINYGSPDGTRWQSTIYNIYTHTNGCLNISPAVWSNGDPINDNSASMQLLGTVYWAPYTIWFYNWVNCNPGGGAFAFTANSIQQRPDLRSVSYLLNDPGYSAYHSITSIQVTHN